MRALILSALLWVLGCFSSFAAERIALVLGVSDYREPVTRLERSRNDAVDVARLLADRGYKVVSDPNVASKSRLMAKIAEFEQIARTSSQKGEVSALIYYSGHGLEAHKNSWMITADFNLKAAAAKRGGKKEFVRAAYTVEEMFARFDKLGLARMMFVLDACRYTSVDLSGIGSFNVGFDVPESLSPRRSFVLYAATKERPAYVQFDGDDGKHSVFTHFFLKRLKEANWEASALLNTLQNDVLGVTRKRVPPQEPAGYDGISGSFHLFGPLTISPNEPTKNVVVPIFYKDGRRGDARLIAQKLVEAGVSYGLVPDDFTQLKKRYPMGAIRLARSSQLNEAEREAFNKTRMVLEDRFGEENVSVKRFAPDDILHKPFHVQLH